MLKVLATLLLLGLVIFSIIKKYNIPSVMLLVSVIGLIGLTIVTKNSVMGDKTIGSKFLDVFEKIFTSAKGTVGGNVLIIMSMLGYVRYMDSIKASEMFAMLIASPLKKIKAKYVLAAMIILVGSLLKIVIPSGISVVALIVATLYPVLLQLGCSRATCASATIMSVCACWGPADSSLYNALSLMGIEDVSVSEWFVYNQIPVNLIMLAVIMTVFIFTSKYFDKKENAEGAAVATQAKSPKDVGVPYYYGILPLLPLIIILVFSTLIIKSIIISVVAAVYLALLIAWLVNLVTKRNLKEGINSLQAAYDGMGDYIKGPGILMVYGTLFSSVLTSIGGMSVIASTLAGMKGGSFILVIVGGALGFVMAGITGGYNANINIAVPFMRSIVEATGLPALPFCHVAVAGTGLGSALTPVSGAIIFVAGQCDVNIMTLVKRNILPLLCGLIAMVLSTWFMFA